MKHTTRELNRQQSDTYPHALPPQQVADTLYKNAHKTIHKMTKPLDAMHTSMSQIQRQFRTLNHTKGSNQYALDPYILETNYTRVLSEVGDLCQKYRCITQAMQFMMDLKKKDIIVKQGNVLSINPSVEQAVQDLAYAERFIVGLRDRLGSCLDAVKETIEDKKQVHEGRLFGTTGNSASILRQLRESIETLRASTLDSMEVRHDADVAKRMSR